MKISDFIEETLSEIALGVHSAKLNVAEIVAVAPGTLNQKVITEPDYVEFELSVTVKEAEETAKSKGGGGGVSAKIAIVEANIDAKGVSSTKENSASETVSKLKFRVPIQLNANYNDTIESNPDFRAHISAQLETVRKRIS